VSGFIQELSGYIASELTRNLTEAGGELRIGFAGPPDAQLSELFDALVGGAGGTRFESVSGPVVLPTFLLDSGAHGGEGNSASRRCNQQELTKIRNFGPPQYLFLLPCTEALVGTHTGTTETIGISKPFEQVDDWIRTSLVEHLIKRALAKYSSNTVPSDKLRLILDLALRMAWESDEGHRDRRNSWGVIRRLFDSTVSSVKAFEMLCAIVGLPRCSADELGTKPHCRILRRLADLFERVGLRPGVDWIRERAAEDLIGFVPSVGEFAIHVFSRCRTGSDFAASPAESYSPIHGTRNAALPEWWMRLTLKVWEQLLDTHDETPQAGLRVTCCNTLVPSLKGIPNVVESNAKFEICVDDTVSEIEVSVERAIDMKRFQPYASFCASSEHQAAWQDTAPEEHEKQLRYRFSAQGYKPSTLKFISLAHYVPGVVIYSRTASLATPFRLNKKARYSKGKKLARYECEISLHGIGTHQIDLYTRSDLYLGEEMVGYDVDSGQGEGVSRPINRASENHAVCLIETDEESYYEFVATPGEGAEQVIYCICIEADETAPTGALSEFDRLVLEHVSAAKGDRANARVEPLACRVSDMQMWAIEEPDSYFPVIIGPDYLDAWRKPDYGSSPVLSRLDLMLDPRPSADEFNAPSGIVDVRRGIQEHLRPDSDEPVSPIELAHLGEKMCLNDFRDAVVRYLDLYRQWLQSDPSSAIWMDVIAVHASEGEDSTLSPSPYALLLSPLHPLRLGWQCNAQLLLKQALDNHLRCPGASLLDPTAFPDCLLLPCKTATGRIENRGFVSVANTSDYWGVLWSTDDIARLSIAADDTIFGPDFGILISGLATGFSVQQVVKSLNEVSRLSAAKTSLRVALASDTTGASSCNDGVDFWTNMSLGPGGDEWHSAGGREVRIHDERHPSLQPEQAALASLTARTKSAIRWFTGLPTSPEDTVDLGIVAHLGTGNPSFQVEGMRSAVDPTGLTRWRIRKQVGSNGDFIAESRIGSIPPRVNLEAFSGNLLAAVDAVECICRDNYDSYVFAPKLPTLEKMIRRARYCAVSSSSVDTACFFKATDISYLWDYELPPYGRRAGENSGYFLLAKESPTMARAVRKALQVLCPGSDLEEAKIHSLLREISRRGMPTLRRLTTGGAASLGEVGMLVALRVLQSEFIEGEKPRALIPVHKAGSDLNLVVPADPFKDQFDQLRSAIPGSSTERPDLLILSIKLLNGTPLGIKITPIEVKARTTLMSATDRQGALSQASEFAKFLTMFSQELSAKSDLWAISWRSLLASLLDYAFRVYGQLPEFLSFDRWSELHFESLMGVMAGSLATRIDECGRLIVIEKTNSSFPDDVDGDGFKETIVLSHADAYKLVSGEAAAFIEASADVLGDWNLPLELGNAGPLEPGATTPTPQPIQPTDATTAATKDRTQPTTLPLNTGQGESATKSPRPQLPSQPEDIGLTIPIGTTVDAFQEEKLRFHPGNTALNQLNVGIVGDLGTGKTQLVKGLIHQLTSAKENNRGIAPRFLIFDYKKDYTKNDFVNATGARVVAPYHIPVNFFDTRDCSVQQHAWLERSKFFIDALDKIYSGIGPLQRQRIKDAVRDSYQHAQDTGRVAPTIYDVFSAYAAAMGTQVDSPYSIMSDIVDGEYFAREENEILPFSEFMTGIVVVDLAAVGQDDRTKNMLVVFLLNLLYEHMLKIEKRPFVGKDPQLRFVDTFLLVDEADNIMKYEFDVLRKVLLQGREFGVGVILASQYLSHFRTQHENYCEPLLTWFVHKVPNVTVKELQGIGLTRVDAGVVDRIKSLACHECLYKTYDTDGAIIRGTPFYEILVNV